MRGFGILALALMLMGAASSARANLVTDPGFESCTALDVVTDATLPDWDRSTINVYCNTIPHSGSYNAEFAGNNTSLSQRILTTSGDVYDFSFWIKHDTDSGNTFTASFGSDEVFNLTSNGAPSAYTQEDFTVTATGPITIIVFSEGVFTGGDVDLDDVSVTDGPVAAPEPVSLALFLSGLFGLRVVRRRG